MSNLDTSEIPVVILCGGKGMRIRQVSDLVAKPMLRIGEHPILWHIMRIHAHYGFRRFILCLGHLGFQIKEYFLEYYSQTSDLTLDFSRPHTPPTVDYHEGDLFAPDWKITLVETGPDTMTGGRVARIDKYLDNNTFMLTYGDGVGDVDLKNLLSHHRKSGALLTVTGVHPASRFGHLEVDGDQIIEFAEKPQTDSGYVSGGFMVAERSFIQKYLSEDNNCVLERDGVPNAARNGQVSLYRHDGFWMPMDNHLEYNALNEMWSGGNPPWKVW